MLAACADRNRECARMAAFVRYAAPYADDGQMPTACLKLDVQFDPHARCGSPARFGGRIFGL